MENFSRMATQQWRGSKTTWKFFASLGAACSLFGGTPLAADSVRFFADGPQCLAVRTAMLRAASSSIDITMFIWRPDDTGLGVAALLREATRRGVRVRVIFDAVASELPPPVVAALKESPLFEARVYHLPHVHELSRLNRRMHEKLVIIDRDSLMIGGRNFSDDYFHPEIGGHYLDLDLLAKGAVAAAASRHFDALWASSQVDRPEWRLPSTPARERRVHMKLGNEILSGRHQGQRMIDTALRGLAQSSLPGSGPPVVPVRSSAMTFVHDLIPKLPGKSTSWAAMAEQLQAARHELWLVTPWLVTTPDNIKLLQGCLQRGVRVHIVTNSLNACRDPLVFAAHSDSCRQLAANGCAIHLMPGPASLHSKAMVIDQTVAVVGSQNFDPRSELWNTESMVIVHDRNAARGLLATIRQQTADAYLLDPQAPNMLGPPRPGLRLRWKNAYLSLLRLIDPILRPVL